MQQIEFRVPRTADLKKAGALIERVSARCGLVASMKGSLAAYPGSVHWHFKKQKEKGTLEITLHPGERRIWAQVQAGRKAAWIDQTLPHLRRTIEKELRGLPLRA